MRQILPENCLVKVRFGSASALAIAVVLASYAPASAQEDNESLIGCRAQSPFSALMNEVEIAMSDEAPEGEGGDLRELRKKLSDVDNFSIYDRLNERGASNEYLNVQSFIEQVATFLDTAQWQGTERAEGYARYKGLDRQLGQMREIWGPVCGDFMSTVLNAPKEVLTYFGIEPSRSSGSSWADRETPEPGVEEREKLLGPFLIMALVPPILFLLDRYEFATNLRNRRFIIEAPVLVQKGAKKLNVFTYDLSQSGMGVTMKPRFVPGTPVKVTIFDQSFDMIVASADEDITGLEFKEKISKKTLLKLIELAKEDKEFREAELALEERERALEQDLEPTPLPEIDELAEVVAQK